jgi:AcrR family transcriptional regulator
LTRFNDNVLSDHIVIQIRNIMNKRQVQKQQTRNLILQQAKNCFISKGFLNTTTSEIATECGIAHGTLFLHFNNKEILIIEILDQQLEIISLKIIELIREAYDLKEMLNNYLDFIEREEDFFHTITRELPFYSDELRRKIIFRESLIRKKFVKAIDEGIARGNFITCDSVMAATFLFSTISYYLSLKNIFVSEGSVIAKFKDKIILTFLSFLTRREDA